MYPSLVGLRAVSGPFMYKAARLYACDACSTSEVRCNKQQRAAAEAAAAAAAKPENITDKGGWRRK